VAVTVRAATLGDLDALVRHRVRMFLDMGVEVDTAMLEAGFTRWLQTHLPDRSYRAWLAVDEHGTVAGGGGATIIPWPPGPRYPGSRLAFVYNVYTEPAFRRCGVARRVMETIHAFCRAEGITSVALNASRDGRPLYDALGYAVTPSPMMFLALSGYNPSA
jgi:GNAT superfamily N-acetyltransferase